MIAKVTIVKTMRLVMIKSMDLPVNVLLDGVEPNVNQVRNVSEEIKICYMDKVDFIFFFFTLFEMWMNAKANHVSTMGLVMMEQTHSAAHVHLDGVESFVI